MIGIATEKQFAELEAKFDKLVELLDETLKANAAEMDAMRKRVERLERGDRPPIANGDDAYRERREREEAQYRAGLAWDKSAEGKAFHAKRAAEADEACRTTRDLDREDWNASRVAANQRNGITDGGPLHHTPTKSPGKGT